MITLENTDVNESFVVYHIYTAGQKPTAHELKVRSLSKSWISVNSGGFN